MSEYWVSKKKYFCKYCDIYIADDAPSRQHHENGLRHKGNVERFIRGIYKTGEKKKKDQEEEKREMARVEQAARAAFALDVSSGHAKASSAPVASTSSAPRKPATKPSNPYANYSTAAQLGFTDPDAEKLEIRKQQGLVGDWQVVQPSPPPVPQEGQEEQDVKHDAVADAEHRQDTDTSVKRPAEVPPDDSRSFKLRKKTASAGLGELYDPGLIPIEVKKKKEEIPTEPETTLASTSSTSEIPKWTSISLKPLSLPSSTSAIPTKSSPPSTTAPKAEETDEKPLAPTRWAKVAWNQPLKEEEVLPAVSLPQEPPIANADAVKTEERDPTIKLEQNSSSLTSEPDPPTASLFKKRKTAGRGRRQL
ncbi:hypothetical protein AGABI1DRAFT_65486 [Agaricus bisporus var. burnettii JB137-S8]|uniref:Matrin-type domain-containing protein n=1 Tax=Agaricus bisporus var. burnettii (strain JB137-S8 / ATCC MYA-4627 / FGSC 10392) TaxID=597362 RepID=K5WHD8_AGABU|nr:uncharacterized protein AGABI1DRAFT_65486 [Agaricus bisporus var. burnettii JB137-S8]EKM74661.1 hypothetical protein AGABI1DRAFT_65486 [Agaricus bisporus var. burnettii JB137-S8]